MKAMNSRTIVAVTAVVAFLAVSFSILKRTVYPAPSPPCPHCGAKGAVVEVSKRAACDYSCRVCGKWFEGPPRSDFSWAGAARVMLQDAGFVE